MSTFLSGFLSGLLNGAIGALTAILLIHLTERRRLRQISRRALKRLERDYKLKHGRPL